MRIDKYIWAIRLFKTRSLSSKACKDEKVKLNGSFTKASKAIEIYDELSVKEIPIWRTFKVISIPKSRIGAKLIADCIEETTPALDLEKLALVQQENRHNKQLGIKGRPTKKDRRDIEKLL